MGITNQNNALYWATGIDNSGLKTDADEAKKIIGGMSGSIINSANKTAADIDTIGKTAIASAKEQITAQRDIIKQIESDIKNIEKQASTAAPGTAKSGLLQEVNSAKQALAEEKAVLAGLEAQVDSVGSSHVRLRTQIMNAKDELSQMEMAGKRGTVEYSVLQKSLGELNDQFKDTSAQATILANDEKGFQAIAQTVSGMAGAFSAATGVISLFGSENEDLVKVQARLQAVMAITIGLQQVSEMLNKDSYFSVVLLTKAKEMWAATNLKVATTLGITTAASKVLMATLTLGLSVAIGAAIYLFDKWSTKQQEAAKQSAEFGKKASESLGEPIAKIQSLSDKWSSLGDNLKEKKKFVDENKDAFKELGVQVNNVADAENLLVVNKDAFIQSTIAKAKAAAGMELAAESYKKAMQKMFEADKLADTVDVYTSSGGQSNTGGGTMIKSTVKNSTKEDLKKEHAELLAEGDKFIKESDLQTKKADEALAKGKIDKFKEIERATKEKATKEAYNAEKELQTLLLDINAQTSKLLLDQKEDSLAKRLSQIEAEKQAEIRQIEDKEASIIDAYNKSHKGEKGFVPAGKVSDISQYQGSALDNAKTAVTSAYNQQSVDATKKYGEEMTALVMQYAEERVQIEYDYNKEIQKLAQEGFIVKAAELATGRDKKISEVSKGLIEESSAYKLATDDQLQISRETTALLIADIKKRIEAAVLESDITKRLSREDADQMLKQIDSTQAGKETSTNNPFTNLINGLNQYKKAKEELSKIDKNIDLGKYAEMEAAANKALTSTAAASGAALQGVQSILGSVVSSLDDLGALSDEQKDTANQVVGMVGGAANLAMGIATGNPMAIIQGSIDMIVNGYKLLDGESKKIEQRIASDKKAVEELKKAYDRLGEAIQKAYSTDKAKLIAEQTANLQEQKKKIEDAKAAEEQKSKNAPKPKAWEYLIPGWNTYRATSALLAPKTDQKEIDKYNAQLEEIAKKEKENEVARIEALTGTDIMSAIDEVAQAYADVWSSGEDSAKNSFERVKGWIRTALIDQLKSKLQPEVTAIMNSIADAIENDGKVDAAEQAAIDVLTGALDAKAAQYKDALDPYLEKSKQSAVTGELQAAMTEGTGSQLVGLWNMTAMDIRSIKEFMLYGNKVDLAKTVDISASVGSILAETVNISRNTLRTANNTDGLVNTLATLKDELRNINNNTKTSTSRR